MAWERVHESTDTEADHYVVEDRQKTLQINSCRVNQKCYIYVLYCQLHLFWCVSTGTHETPKGSTRA